MRALVRTCVLLGAGLTSLVLAVAPTTATYRGANGLIVYQADAANHVQLFTVKSDGSGARRLTHLRDSNAISPSWSRDGQHIAFARDYATGQPKEHLDIVTMDADGSNMHALGLHGLNGNPTWSADGQILWLHPGGFQVSNPDGTGLRMIKVPGENGSPTFSPDGTRIAFVRDLAKDTRAIFVINADGSHLQRLKSFPHGIADKIDWSPDGSRIGFAAPAIGALKNTSTNVFTIRPDGTGLKQLTHAHGGKINDAIDSWSPDGRQIAFVSNRGGVGGYQIWVMNADGSGGRQLTHGGPESHFAAWGSHA